MVWADETYQYRKEITIQNGSVAEDVTDFPVLISVTDLDLRTVANGGHVRSASGYDIVFYDSTNTTLLSHEIELNGYAAATGVIIMWVKMPSISSTEDTILYMYYGKPDVIVNPSETDTWNDDYVIIHHMDDVTTSAVNDSTTNGNDGVKAAANKPLEIAGQIGKAQQTAGDSGHWIDCNEDASLTITAEITIEAWYRNSGEVGSTFGRFTDWYPAPCIYTHEQVGAAAHLRWYGVIGGVALDTLLAAGVLPVDTWVHVAVTYKDDVSHVVTGYINGISVGTDNTRNGALTARDDDLILMNRTDGTERQLMGDMDEFRISKVKRTVGWLLTTFNTADDPAGFMTWGTEQGLPVRPMAGMIRRIGNPTPINIGVGL